VIRIVIKEGMFDCENKKVKEKEEKCINGNE
jgi:hypothetical protein